jgi:hypothetical protein
MDAQSARNGHDLVALSSGSCGERGFRRASPAFGKRFLEYVFRTARAAATLRGHAELVAELTHRGDPLVMDHAANFVICDAFAKADVHDAPSDIKHGMQIL